MNLLIVESPAKAKTIQQYLGQGWEVKASYGHIRDLPDNEIAVYPPNFKPKYTWLGEGKKVCEMLLSATNRALNSGGEVYLASDNDREGEAIAWHLQQVLGLKNPKRITFGEISKKEIIKAVQNPRNIDVKLVAAQETRRVLDRLVGYHGSPYAQELLGDFTASVGRVQSVAVKLICDREKDIRSHETLVHYGVEFKFDGWEMTWKPVNACFDKNFAEIVANIKSFKVKDLPISLTKSSPPPPFITSTLQQAASNTLNFKAKKCMELAQSLYEKGLITYMRTDQPNLTDDMLIAVREYCKLNNLPISEEVRTWQSKENAQEAHKAIQPTDINLLTAGDTEDEQALYKLIWKRTVTCQMADAVFTLKKIILETDLNNNIFEIIAEEKTLKDPGYKLLSAKDETIDDEQTEENNNFSFPTLSIGSDITTLSGKVIEFKTKSPKRYTEAALVRQLEKSGIGRPSSYANILESITSRSYVTSKKNSKFFELTQKGEDLINLLENRFSFLNIEFTKEMELTLDKIAVGKANYLTTVTEFYNKFQDELNQAYNDNKPKYRCKKCGKGLIKLTSKKDKKVFYACYNTLTKKCDGLYNELP